MDRFSKQSGLEYTAAMQLRLNYLLRPSQSIGQLLTQLLIVLSVTLAIPIDGQGEEKHTRLPPGWSQGHIEVPLDHSNPDSKLIEIAFYVRIKAQSVPLLFLNGGPAMSGAPAIPALEATPELKHRTLVVMDQRGTGSSSPFPYLEDPDAGKDFQHFGSAAIVRDAEAIREHLFQERPWSIMGQSYGGLIAFRYLEDRPQGLHRVFIHGFGDVPASSFLSEREAFIERLSQRFLAHRPNFWKPTIGSLLERLNSPATTKQQQILLDACIDVPGSIAGTFCPRDLKDGLSLVIGFQSQWNYAHEQLSELSKDLKTGNSIEFKNRFRHLVNIFMLRFNKPYSSAALNMITFLELTPGLSYQEACDQAQPNAGPSECRLGHRFLIRTDISPQFLPRPLNFEIIRKNIQDLHIPVVLAGGQLDTFIPPTWVERASRRIGKCELLIFPSSGHEGYKTEPLWLQRVGSN